MASTASAEFEYEWQFSIGDNATLVDTPAVPETSIKTLVDQTPVGVRAEDDLYVYRALRFCLDAPRDQSAYDARRLGILTTRSPDGWTVVDDTRPALQVLAAKFELCRELEPDDLSSLQQRLKSAADLGLPQAKLEYAQHIANNTVPANTTPEQVARYFGLIDEAKNLGVADAYFWSGSHGLDGLNGRSKVAAIADLMVADAIFQKYGIRANTAALVDREYARLRPEKRAQARAQALEMASAESCCTLFYGKTWEETLGEVGDE